MSYGLISFRNLLQVQRCAYYLCMNVYMKCLPLPCSFFLRMRRFYYFLTSAKEQNKFNFLNASKQMAAIHPVGYQTVLDRFSVPDPNLPLCVCVLCCDTHFPVLPSFQEQEVVCVWRALSIFGDSVVVMTATATQSPSSPLTR